jgi:signal transduction histidine kinase
MLEEQNRELERVKAEMQKLASISSRFMLTMVHILRAPVAVLQNSVQLIQKGYVPAEEQPALLERIGQRAGELLTILDDVLLLSQLKEGVSNARLEKVLIADVLGTVLAELKSTAEERRISVAVEILERPSLLPALSTSGRCGPTSFQTPCATQVAEDR